MAFDFDEQDAPSSRIAYTPRLLSGIPSLDQPYSSMPSEQDIILADAQQIPPAKEPAPLQLPRQPASQISPVKRLQDTLATAQAAPDLGYSADISDAALKKAIADKRQAGAWGDVAAGAAKLGAALGSRGRELPTVDESQYKVLEKYGAQNVADIETRRTAAQQSKNFEKAMAELQDQKAMMDPNSAISKLTVDMVKKQFPNINVDGMSASQLDKMGLNVSKVIASQQHSDAMRSQAADRALNMARLQSDADVRQIGKYQTDYERSTEKLRDAVSGAGRIKALLAEKNAVADAAIPGMLAKLSGEVGVLTEQDVQRFSGSKALASKYKRMLEVAISGKLPEKDRQDMAVLVDVMRLKREEQFRDAENRLIKQGSKRLKQPESEIRNILGLAPAQVDHATTNIEDNPEFLEFLKDTKGKK